MVIKKSKILVIGGAGFIGSNLCKALSFENDVFSLDNYYTGSETNHVKKVKYIRANAKDIGSLNLGYDFDYIFHFGEYRIQDVKRYLDFGGSPQVRELLTFSQQKEQDAQKLSSMGIIADLINEGMNL